MHDKYLYEYAVIRVLPRVEREEFLNVGIILFSKRKKFIGMKYVLNKNRLSLFSTELDLDLLQTALDSFQRICNGEKAAGAIAQFDIPERFRWLTAVRSSCLQTSRPHPGFADDLNLELDRLFQELVL